MQKGSENMNKIFKVIWSKTRNCYVVASELAKGRTKAASTGDKAKRLALAAITALMLLPVGGFSYAADSITIGTFELKDTNGNEQKVLTVTQGDASTIGTTLSQVSTNQNDIATLQKQVSTNTNDIAKKANATDVYTKTETDQKVDAANKYTYRKVAAEEKARKAADTELNERITNEANAIHDEIKAGDKALDDRITNVKEYLEKQTSDNYVSKADAAVQDGAIVKAANTIGENVTNLDAALVKETAARIGADKAQDAVIQQVNQNAANGIATLATAYNNEVASREAADNELNERITNEANAIHETTNQLQSHLSEEAKTRESKDNELNERITNEANAIHDEIKAGDEKLDTRITNVKEYLEKQTSDTYVSKDDAAVQDGAIVKADKTIGENVTNLDAALAKETAARLGADKAQERAAADAALDDKITAETSARVAADAKLVEAVNSGLSLSNDNVLQKNTTSVGEDGTVTTSKEAATTLVMNKGGDNQITLSDKGIKVGLNSTVQDANGFYAGGDTAAAAKAALNADGSIKGADGKFTVDTAGNVATKGGSIKTNGGVIQTGGGNINTQGGALRTNGGNINAGSGTITGNKLTDGVASLQNGNLTTTGNINAHDIVATGDISGKAITGTSLNTQGGDINGGAITGTTITGTTGAFGSLITTGNASVGGTLSSNGLTNTGNATTDTLKVNHNATVGGDLAVTGDITGKSLNVGTGAISGGQITGTGLDVGAGTIKTTGAVETGTLETTGNATIGGNLTVDKDLTVNGVFDAKTLSSTVDANNYTTINGGKTQSVNLKLDVVTGETKASASIFDENGSNTWAKDDESIGKSTVTADGISQKLSDLGDNPQAYAERAMSQSTDNKYSMVDTVKDANGNTSTFRQRVDAILQEINNADGDTLTKVEQTDTAITSQIGDGSAIKSVMNADGIANTATGKSITNDAADIINTGTNSVTNQVGSNKVVVDTTGVKSAYGDNTYTTWNAEGITNSTDGNMTNTVGGEMKTTVTGKVTEDYKSDLDTKVGGNETHYVAGNQTNTVSGDRTVNVKGTETENFNAQVTSIKTNQRTSVGGNQTNIVAGNQQNTVSGSKTETVKGSVTEKYGSQATTVDGDQSTHVGGNQENVVTGNQTNTISGSKTETVKGSVSETYGSQTTKVNGDQSTTVTGKQTNSITGDQVNTIGGSQTTTVTGDVTEDYKANLSTTVGGNQTTTVTGASSLTAENINNTAKNKITNKAIDVETDASSSIVNKVSNDAGSNISTQLSYETKEEMSQADGKTASYLRGAAEEKSQLTDGDKKTTIDTVAGQTNTNITEGKNISNSLQKADQVASSVTDGTNTTVVNQDAKSLASSITDGTKANNSSNTVDKSEQLIKASDTQYSATSKTATKMEDALVSGGSVIDVIKNLDDAGSPTISSAVTDGTNSTGVTQTAKDITNTAKNGTIANDAKDITNNASTSILNQVRDNTSWKMTDGQVVESIKGADGQTNTTTTTADDTYQSVQNGNKVLAKRTSSTNDNLNITDGTNTYSKITTATSNKQTVTDGKETASTNLTKSASNTYITNGTQTVTNHIAADTTNTIMNEGSNGSRQEQTASQILDRVTDGTNTNSTTTTASGTTFENTAHNTALTEMTKHESGDFTKTTISGNTIETGQATMDYAEVMKDLGVHGNATVDQKLTVKGDSDLQGNANVGKNLTVNGTSDLKGNVTMESNATVAGSMTASSYKVGGKTYISESGINANNQKVVNVAAGDLSANSTDAVNGAQLYQTNERVTGVENKVNKLDSRVDKVGANAAALANLHPLEFDADSKWNIAAAVGGYKGETATAIGAFYRPNENVMVNVSSSFGTGENMYGGGISLRIGQGGNKARRNATNGLTEREKAMQKQIDSLTSRLDALLSVINPNMSKDFPDVPENHWAYEAVSRLAGNGVIQGYEDGKYHGDRTMTRYEMAEIIYNALSKGAKAEKKLVEEFKPELQAMAAQKKA